MPRNIDAILAAGIVRSGWMPVVFVQLTFRTGIQYVWSGIGSFVWNGNTFTGVGSLGEIGDVAEGIDVKATGTSVKLSGIDPVFLSDSLDEIQCGQPARVWMGMLLNGVLVGTPYLRFSGYIDTAPIDIGDQTCSIALALETRMSNHGRASNRRYTTADQHANGYPTDTGFSWVELMNDIALNWGG
jgi:hypothetical protein